MAAPAKPPNEKDFYIRRLIYSRDESLVESRCSRCGTLIIGSATKRLIADELEHMRQCLESHKIGCASKTSVATLRGAWTA